MSLLRGEIAGHPVRNERWIRRSLKKIQRALMDIGHHLSCTTIRRLLLDAKIRPRANVKHLAPKPHPDRDKQFLYVMSVRVQFESGTEPIVSVDAKNKEKIGLFAQAGHVWAENAPEVYALDFPQRDTKKATPFGIYDVRRNRGFVCVGLSGNTPDFAIDSLRAWWKHEGRVHYRHSTKLLILADGGGSNGYRPRRWKTQLQRFADKTGLEITVCHYPPGASKWNPIEHRLFRQISNTWAGTPLTSLEHLLEAIRFTTTETGLRVSAILLDRIYPTKLRASKEEWMALNIFHHATCPMWNYTIKSNRHILSSK